jgi:peptidoglycan hydrolase-like protein with peptidoglycan-binding domain
MTGSAGADVCALQATLNFLQMANPPLVVDGIFGPNTTDAVIAFQGSVDLQTDGIVGPMTAQALAGAVFFALCTGSSACCE